MAAFKSVRLARAERKQPGAQGRRKIEPDQRLRADQFGRGAEHAVSLFHAAHHNRRAGHRHVDIGGRDHLHRSEEHTSELQSLMRISYAVFCLKKKKTQYVDKYTSSQTKKTNTQSLQHM